jgi:hypothetical protein
MFQQFQLLNSSTRRFYQGTQMGSPLVPPHHIFLKHKATTLWHNVLQSGTVSSPYKRKKQNMEKYADCTQSLRLSMEYTIQETYMTNEVVTVVTMKSTISWDASPC